ncbi:hypothetical protein C8R44DRAFT_767891, partial [Mycena epipterygia]
MCTTTCRRKLVDLGVPLSTSGYLGWTAFGYLRLLPSTSVSVGTLTSSKLTVLIWAHLGFSCVWVPLLCVACLSLSWPVCASDYV